MAINSIDEMLSGLLAQRYICDRETATSVYLAIRLRKPLLLEGEPGVGKASLARALADALETRLISLQCHEDLDEGEAVYEWNTTLQLLRIRLAGATREPKERVEQEVQGEDYLIRRPLLEAIRCDSPEPPVLLIREADRLPEHFQTFLAGFLTEWRLEIPGTGTLRARQVPTVILTSNAAAPIRQALQRVVVYRWVERPDFGLEYDILLARVPGVSRQLAGQLCNVAARLRSEQFSRPPGIGELVAWAQSLAALRRTELTPDAIDQTLGCILKDRADIRLFRERRLHELLAPAVDRVG